MTRVLAAIAIACAPAAVRAEYLTGVAAAASSEQVKGLFAADNLVNGRGLTETKPGGELALTDNASADKGCMWQSGYRPAGPDETPLVQFDFGREVTVAGFRVWNHNAQPSRGFKDVAVYASADGKEWRTVPQRFRFAKAPGKPGYTGEEHAFDRPVTARFLRFWAEGTHRTGGQPDLAGLGKVRFVAGKKPAADPPAPAGPLPFDAGVVSVTDPPYSAKGDGATDDTAAIQKAIDDTQGTRRLLYLPAGTYLVSRPLAWKNAVGHGHLQLRGAGRDRTVIRLKDGTFTDPKDPKAVVSNGFNGTPGGRASADWFHNHFADFAIDTGRGNPGAVGLRFYSNNLGLLKNVDVRSGDGAGVVGLDLAPADMNGPLLVRGVAVSGFDTGVRAGGTVNSQTIDGLRLEGQKKVGLRNEGQCLTVRRLAGRNAVPAVESTFGVLALVDCELTGVGAASGLAAVTSGEVLFARNVKAAGYKAAVRNTAKGGTPDPDGTEVAEYVSHRPIAVGGGQARSLGLPVKEPPEPPADDPAGWANVRHFRAVDDPDDTASLQRAIDSGAATVYLPPGQYAVSGPVEVRGKVRRVAGMFARVRAVPAKDRPAPALHVAVGDPATVFLDDLLSTVPVVNPSGRTLVVRNCEMGGGRAEDRGELYLENVVGRWAFGKGQAVWARQLNAEDEGVHLTNAGGTVWVLGLKTERGGVLLDTLAGGRTEVLGGLCYTTTKGKLGPMFRVAAGGRLSATLGEVCYTGDPYAVLVEAAAGGEQPVTLRRGDAPLRPAFLQGSALPLVTARR